MVHGSEHEFSIESSCIPIPPSPTIAGWCRRLGSGLACGLATHGTSRLVVILPVLLFNIYANRARIYYRPRPPPRALPGSRGHGAQTLSVRSARLRIESAVASRPEVGPRPVCAQRPRTATVITPLAPAPVSASRRATSRGASRRSVNGSRLPSLRLAVSAVSLTVHRPFTAYRRSTRHGTPRVRPVPDPVPVLACCVFCLARVSTCT